MATYTTIPTFTSGQVLTSSTMNSVKNNLDLTNAQSAFPYRNLLHNGAMQVSQRGASAASKTTSDVWLVDRWRSTISSLGTWTASRESDAPSESGLRASLKMLCTAADASPAAGDVFLVRQILEGYDVQRIKKGTASAEQLTLTFWVKSNVTGTYVVELEDQDNTRYCSATYTVSASATWEQKSITFPADTTGAFDNDENGSLALNFWMGGGTNFTSGTLGTTWHTTSANRAVGGTNVASANNNYWQVTGVQLEIGTVSTPFEFIPYADELARCQRYYYRSSASASNTYARYGFGSSTAANTVQVCIPFPVTMRTVASATVDYASLSVYDGGAPAVVTGVASDERTPNCHVVSATVAGVTLYRPYFLLASNTASSYIGFSAEL